MESENIRNETNDQVLLVEAMDKTFSNVGSKKSTGKSQTKSSSSTSSRSSTSSARLQAEAERAALAIRAAALRERHALEEQQETLRRKKEKLEIDTQLAAAEAKVAVLKPPSHQAPSTTHSDGLESHIRTGTRPKEPAGTLNPHAKDFQPSQLQPPASQQPFLLQPSSPRQPYTQQPPIQQTTPAKTGSKSVDKARANPQSKPRFKGDSFATAATIETPIVEDLGRLKQNKESAHTTNSCVCCCKGHTLDQCPQFKNKAHRDKITFIRTKGICFGCLHFGHISKDCKKCLICKKCNQKHPSVLHINQKEKASNTDTNRQRKPSVKSKKEGRIFQTYAFLDPGSTDTFCSENLMRKLNLTGRKTQISLLTMGAKTSVSSYMLTDLEISSLTGKQFYDLPMVYTQKRMPVSTKNMMKEEELAKWPYLKGVAIPHIQAEVELLIGTNASKLLEPWEVINSRGNGPYAIKTLLGWVINGDLSGHREEQSKSGYPVASVNRISITNLEQLLISQHKHELKERSSKDRKCQRTTGRIHARSKLDRPVTKLCFLQEAATKMV